MAQNCSTDVSLVIEHIDSALSTGTADDIASLKGMFGLAGLEHNDDFAALLPAGPYDWQGNDFYTGYSPFFQFCDAVENAVPGSNTTTPATGVGLEKALAGYANWIKTSVLPGCKLSSTLKGKKITNTVLVQTAPRQTPPISRASILIT